MLVGASLSQNHHGVVWEEGWLLVTFALLEASAQQKSLAYLHSAWQMSGDLADHLPHGFMLCREGQSPSPTKPCGQALIPQ